MSAALEKLVAGGGSGAGRGSGAVGRGGGGAGLGIEAGGLSEEGRDGSGGCR